MGKYVQDETLLVGVKDVPSQLASNVIHNICTSILTLSVLFLLPESSSNHRHYISHCLVASFLLIVATMHFD